MENRVFPHFLSHLPGPCKMLVKLDRGSCLECGVQGRGHLYKSLFSLSRFHFLSYNAEFRFHLLTPKLEGKKYWNYSFSGRPQNDREFNGANDSEVFMIVLISGILISRLIYSWLS